MHLHRTVFWHAALVFLLAFPALLQGCSCSPRATFPSCANFDWIDTVILGRPVAKIHLPPHDQQFPRHLYIFEVLESLRGNLARHTMVLVDPDNVSNCQTDFALDTVYLLRARSSPGSKIHSDYEELANRSPLRSFATGGVLYLTSQCFYSVGADFARRDVQLLRRWNAQARRTGVVGVVSHRGRLPFDLPDDGNGLADIRVQLSAARGLQETWSCTDGFFEFPNVPPGTYPVKITAPGYTTDIPLLDVVVPEDGCGYTTPVLNGTSSVEGILLHHDGTPAVGVQVEAHRIQARGADTTLESFVARSTDSGRFRLQGLAAGHFRLAMNTFEPGTPQRPYPPAYFPGVPNSSQAERIILAPGSSRTGLVWFLPPPSATRQVRVTIHWPNGTPAAGVQVDFLLGNAYAQSASTNARGEARAEVLANLPYQLRALHYASSTRWAPPEFRNTFFNTEPQHLPAGTGPHHLTVTLKP